MTQQVNKQTEILDLCHRCGQWGALGLGWSVGHHGTFCSSCSELMVGGGERVSAEVPSVTSMPVEIYITSKGSAGMRPLHGVMSQGQSDLIERWWAVVLPPGRAL